MDSATLSRAARRRSIRSASACLCCGLLALATPAQNRTEAPAGAAPTAATPVPQGGEQTPRPADPDQRRRTLEQLEHPLGLPADSPVVPPQGDWEALVPFRNPEDYLPEPDAVYRALRQMYATVQKHPAQTRIDETGKEVSDHPEWQAAWDALQSIDDATSISQSPGYLVQIIRDSREIEDRRIAFYGSFYFNFPPWVINAINHIPGEPNGDIRADALPRAIAYLRVQLKRKWKDVTEREQETIKAFRTTRDQMDPVEPEPDQLAFAGDLDPRPFLALWNLDDPLAKAQSLWFFKELARDVPDVVRVWLFSRGPQLRALAGAKDSRVRKEAMALIAALSGDAIPSAVEANGNAREAWLKEAIDKALPPPPSIERVTDGLYILRASPELDAVLARGKDVLERDALGEPTSGKDKNGWRYWGLRVDRLPAPLDQLGIPAGGVIVSVNGRPVRRDAELLEVLSEELVAKRKLIVEWVQKKERRAIEYRLRL